MPVFKYFSGTQEVSFNGAIRNSDFTVRFPNIKGVKQDSFSKFVGNYLGQVMPITRIIQYKTNPSLHKCDARCQNAKGRICECECGGKNHGVNG